MTRTDFADHQLGIYLEGLAGRLPELPISIEALERAAREKLEPGAYDYVAGGSGAEATLRDNLTAFDRWQLMPRHLRDVSQRDHRVELPGASAAAPVLLAPIGMLGIVHEEAEVAAARAASRVGLPLMLSTLSSHPLERVAEASGDGPRWFQLYWPGSPAVTASLLGRAEAAGYGAAVVTLDTRVMAWRERDLQRAFLPALRGEGLANYFSDPAFADELGGDPRERPMEAVQHWAQSMSSLEHRWCDLEQLRAATSLPILLKGILHPDDARRAVEAGVDGLVVSNHGGRQVDGAIGALDALPAVVEAVASHVPVLFDSGIRRGADVVKALALGARAVLVGRPWVWGLALAGAEGVETVLRRLLADYDLTMALCGLTRPSEVDRDALVEAACFRGRVES